MNVGFFRRGTHNQRLTQNLGWTPADYTIVNVVSPLDGTVIPVYNLDPAKRANVDRLDVNSTDSDLRAAAPTTAFRRASTRASVASSSSAAGRWIGSSIRAAMRSRATPAATPAPRPSRPTTSRNPTSTSATRASSTCPFLHEFKLAGSYTLPWYGIQANVALQSYNGQPLFTRWNIAPTTRYAANCVGPCRPGELVIPNQTLATYTLDLVAPGQQYYERQNQLDMGFRKIFRFGQVSALRPGRLLQHRQLVLREEPEHHRRHVAWAAAGHPPAAHDASRGAAEVLVPRGLTPAVSASASTSA